jgi:hypothetical protein
MHGGAADTGDRFGDGSFMIGCFHGIFTPSPLVLTAASLGIAAQ